MVISKSDKKSLQSVRGITKCDKKLLQSVRGITKCDNYYKGSATEQTSQLFPKYVSFSLAANSSLLSSNS